MTADRRGIKKVHLQYGGPAAADEQIGGMVFLKWFF
jgi:hypothetical protein